MTCRDFAEFIGDYLSGELPGATRETFESHLSICENCQKYLAIYRESGRLGRGSFGDDATALPTEVPSDLIEAILAARRRPPAR